MRLRTVRSLVCGVLLGGVAACSGADAPAVTIAPPAAAPEATPTAGGPRASAEVANPVAPAATGAAGQQAAQPSPTAEAAVPGAIATAAPAQADTSFPLHPFAPANGRQRVIALDPGHGGEEVGAYGAGVAEKEVNLRIARRLRTLLEAEGYAVVLVRDCDCRAVPPKGLAPPANWQPTRWDLQARLDIANVSGADVYLAIHNNGNPDGRQSGTEVWWDGRRPFAAYNKALAGLVLESVVGAIRGAGYPTINRGLQEDSNFRVFQGRSFPIFVLGPPRTGTATTRAGRMPAVLGETLFLSNPAEAVQLTRPEIIEAIAGGYRDALRSYFGLIDAGALAPPAGGYPAEKPNFFDVQPPNGGTPVAPR